ncbi:MAG: NAD(+) kinase [Ruminococcaceae bacterium]|nr:NAD(+) kinase [Oscillospiraceae bacterium]
MKYNFRKIAVLPNLSKDKGLLRTRELISYLEKDYEVILNKEFSSLAEKCRAKTVSEDDLYSESDLIIVLGGDGSILRAAGKASRASVPIIGINLGRLGYIAEIETSDISNINKILSSELWTEERTMIEAEVIRDGETVISQILGLNDAAIVRATGLGVIETELFCNGQPVYKYRGDGLIAATATGSSAYSMSAGGPVMDTSLDCISVTPICAHSLRCRPIVFSGESVFEIVSRATPDHAKLSVDGSETFDLKDNDVVRIKKSRYVTRLIRTGESNFCNVLYRKMSDI